MTARHLSYLLLLTTGAVIVGGDGIDKVWNLLPCITALAVSETLIYTGGKRWEALPPTIRYASTGLVAGTVLLPLIYNIAWEFRVVGAKIGSVPYAAFWFLPVAAFACGIIGGMAGFLIGNHRHKKTGR